MAYQQREMSGTLFKNDRKQKENQPDLKGEALINGVTYELAAWEKVSSKGTQFFSLSFKVKSASYPTGAPIQAGNTQGTPNRQQEDDLPF